MRSGVDHTVLHANYTTPAFTRSSPGGATTEWTVIAPADEAYYSFIDPERMNGWVGLVGWPTADGLGINGYPSAAGQAQARERPPVKDDVLPLSYTDQLWPGLQLVYWPSRLKALVLWGRRSGRLGSYASLIGLTLAGLKAYERDELPRNGP